MVCEASQMFDAKFHLSQGRIDYVSARYNMEK